jgi:hypothetical protein
MRNAQLTHDDRGKQDDEQHHAEDERGTRDGEICVKVQHFHIILLSLAKVVIISESARNRSVKYS